MIDLNALEREWWSDDRRSISEEWHRSWQMARAGIRYDASRFNWVVAQIGPPPTRPLSCGRSPEWSAALDRYLFQFWSHWWGYQEFPNILTTGGIASWDRRASEALIDPKWVRKNTVSPAMRAARAAADRLEALISI